MYAQILTPAADRSDPVQSVFQAQHVVPVRREGHSTVSETVEAAKARDLRGQREGMLEHPLSQPKGLLGKSPYPRGALIVWGVPSLPQASPEWNDIARVTGIVDWMRWEGDGLRICLGVPESAQFSRRGISMLVEMNQLTVPEDFGSDRPSDYVRWRLGMELFDWLPWLLVAQAGEELADEAGRLRANMDRRIEGAGRGRWLGGLENDLHALHRLEYQFNRLQHATDSLSVADRRFLEFPVAHHVDPRTIMRQTTTPGPPEAGADPVSGTGEGGQRADETPTPTFRDSVFEWITSILRVGTEEVRLSLEHVRVSVEAGTGGVVRRWTVIVGVGQIIILVITAALFAITLYQLMKGGSH